MFPDVISKNGKAPSAIAKAVNLNNRFDRLRLINLRISSDIANPYVGVRRKTSIPAKRGVNSDRNVTNQPPNNESKKAVMNAGG